MKKISKIPKLSAIPRIIGKLKDNKNKNNMLLVLLLPSIQDRHIS